MIFEGYKVQVTLNVTCTFFMLQNMPENNESGSTCTASVDARIIMCRYCEHRCTKYGITKAGKQRLRCLTCKRTSITHYNIVKFPSDLNTQIKTLLKEGCGVRSIGRILNTPASTIIRRIKKIGSAILPPAIAAGQTFELDELCTFIGKKNTPVWLAYAINRRTKRVAVFNIGNRSNQMLSKVTEPLIHTVPLRIYTDKLLQYKSLIPPAIHCTKKYGINHIERKNLTLRTHLKRLSRRTICFSRSVAMLHACLMIYFFG